MKSLVILMTLLAGQMNTMQSREVVHLKFPSAGIPREFGGKLLELIGAPAVINLPLDPPKPDGAGNQWSLDVKNMGPKRSTVIGAGRFNTPVGVGQTIHIFSNGTIYILKH